MVQRTSTWMPVAYNVPMKELHHDQCHSIDPALFCFCFYKCQSEVSCSLFDPKYYLKDSSKSIPSFHYPLPLILRRVETGAGDIPSWYWAGGQTNHHTHSHSHILQIQQFFFIWASETCYCCSLLQLWSFLSDIKCITAAKYTCMVFDCTYCD